MFAVPDLDAPALEIPLFLSPAACGFPSPAQDYVEQTIDQSHGAALVHGAGILWMTKVTTPKISKCCPSLK